MSGYRAVIFDLDGVLVDSEPLFQSAINGLLQEEGADPLTEEENQTLLGTTVEETWRRILGMRSLPLPLFHYLERYDPVVRRVLERELSLQPGVARILEALRERGLKAGVASSSLRAWVDLKLGILGLREAFDVVLGGDEVARGKPEPDIYLQAARLLSLRPQACIAIEDSPPGIAAAEASGAFTIAVRTPSTHGLDVSQARLVLDSLEEFDLSLLDNSILPATNNASVTR